MCHIDGFCVVDVCKIPRKSAMKSNDKSLRCFAVYVPKIERLFCRVINAMVFLSMKVFSLCTLFLVGF